MSDPTDTDVHDALVAFTRAEPPLSFTYDQVLAGGIRTRRRRRFAMIGAATVVTVAAAGLVAVALPHREAGRAPYAAAGPTVLPSQLTPPVESAPPTSGATTPASRRTVTVPDVLAQNAAVAKEILEQVGFTRIELLLNGQHTTATTVPRNWIVDAQSEAPGKMLPTDSLITLNCAQHPS